MRNLQKDQADRYVARLFSGELSDHEAVEIEAWKAKSAENQTAFDASIDAWSSIEMLADDEQLNALMEEQTTKPLTSHNSMLWPIAAGLAVLALLTTQLWPGFESDAEIARYVTDIGERRTIELPDGSTIELNTNSDVIVSMSNRRREVILSKGEAFFDVAKDIERPFTVEAGTYAVTVLGTEFNVNRANRHEMTVAVISGKVGVHRSDDEMSIAVPPLELPTTAGQSVEIATLDQIVLVAGSVAIIHQQGNIASASTTTTNSMHGSWRTGRVRFQNQDLEQVITELNRYSERPIIIQDGALRSIEISAILDLDTPDTFVDSLEAAFPITVTRLSDRILISSGAD